MLYFELCYRPSMRAVVLLVLCCASCKVYPDQCYYPGSGYVVYPMDEDAGLDQ